ncbi:MAG: lptF [Panacagrimonas sp.]|jgi:lipopolysaccharide export system permease protein|nr:LPS export ABC transporter permease LptF [Panacagrimonas sp.]MCC2658284.1 lptF [Panacagrimonas sp.]
MVRGTLDRYLLRETAAATLAVTLVLLAIMLSARFAKFLGAVATGDLPRNLLAQVVALSSIQYLVLLIPAALLLAVMLTLGRLYKDSEVAAMMGCGVSLGGLYRPFLWLSALMALITAWLAFDAGPWAGRHVDYISKDSRRLVQYTPFEPGRFKAVAGGRAVFYTEQIDTTGKKLTTVFVRVQEEKGESVVMASEGRQEVDPATGERHLTLYGGRRYAGTPGSAQFDVVRFDEFETRITPPQFAYTTGKRKLMSTSELMASTDSEDKAELAWRIAAPVSVFVLGLLAVPLSHLQPRQGRYGKLVLGIVLYLLYSNLLGLGQAWIAKGRVPSIVGLWWVHLLFGGAALWLIARRQGWTLGRLAGRASA